MKFQYKLFGEPLVILENGDRVQFTGGRFRGQYGTFNESWVVGGERGKSYYKPYGVWVLKEYVIPVWVTPPDAEWGCVLPEGISNNKLVTELGS